MTQNEETVLFKTLYRRNLLSGKSGRRLLKNDFISKAI